MVAFARMIIPDGIMLLSCVVALINLWTITNELDHAVDGSFCVAANCVQWLTPDMVLMQQEQWSL